jgi:glycerol-3-phosphate dehydrogenase (NAD(P)+)
MSDAQPIGVIGAGSFGTAVANLLAENAPVLLYARTPERVEQLQRERSSAGQALHERIEVTGSLQTIAGSCYLIFPVLPSTFFATMLRQLSPHLRPDHLLIHGTKGLHVESGVENLGLESTLSRESVLTMSELILRETVVLRVGCLHGPNLAAEIAEGLPAATVIGSRFDEVINEGKQALRSPRFQVYGSYDVLGIELAGVLKNILAIGSGMVRGLKMGENARALLMTRGLSELIHLGKVLDIDPRAFLGLAGIGDIIATCSSPQSRNYTVGFRIAQGEKLPAILDSMDEVAEGVGTVRTALALANAYKVSTPIISMLHRILFEDYAAQEGLQRLMSYRISRDVDFI